MRVFLTELVEAFRIAFAQIRANAMRSALTALGVIIGIVAVTLMGTAMRGIDAGVDRSMAGFGDNVLYVSKWPWRDVTDWWNLRNRRPIRTQYAEQVNAWIQRHPEGPLLLAMPVTNRSSTIIRGEYRLNNIFTLGVSADMPRIMRTDLEEGRFFSEFESESGRSVAVIGFDVADALFPGESPLGQTIRVSDRSFEVVGVVARQGSFLGLFSWDSQVVIPLNAFRRSFSTNNNNSELRVQVDPVRMAEARDELRGLMRRLRQLRPEQRDDFDINEQAAIRAQIDPLKNGIAIAGFFITGLALFVGAIGIMNITYVSVKERTREIGTRKALGARRRTILLQFLIEAVSICLLGGVIGLAVAGGLSVAVAKIAPAFPLVFSGGLVGVGLTVSVLTGVFSGFAPAVQASKLDPVVALRYE
jgi:putative ABC transport system permease protein